MTTIAPKQPLTIASLRMAVSKALRQLFESNDARDQRISDLAAEVDGLHARVVALDARLDEIDK